jgi:hypothetical protein
VRARSSPGGALAQRGAAASEPHVAQATRTALAHGNAVDAVATGVLVAAAHAPGVLLGPLQVLVGGAGAGLLAIDGRVRQPGEGAPRPRGFLATEEVPDAARVGVPGLPGALATLVATLGTHSLLRVAGPALEAARALAPERGRVLQLFARRGAPALADSDVADELTAAAGRAERGLLTKEDLAAARPVVVPCDERGLVSGVLFAPWRADPRLDAAHCHVVAACDGKGLAAVACYEVPAVAVPIHALGLVAPLFAAPVLRGHTRIRPGELRPAAAPIALRMLGGIVDLCVGVAQASDGERVLDGVTDALSGDASIAATVSAVAEGLMVALARTQTSVRILASG